MKSTWMLLLWLHVSLSVYVCLGLSSFFISASPLVCPGSLTALIVPPASPSQACLHFPSWLLKFQNVTVHITPGEVIFHSLRQCWELQSLTPDEEKPLQPGVHGLCIYIHFQSILVVPRVIVTEGTEGLSA